MAWLRHSSERSKLVESRLGTNGSATSALLASPADGTDGRRARPERKKRRMKTRPAGSGQALAGEGWEPVNGDGPPGSTRRVASRNPWSWLLDQACPEPVQGFGMTTREAATEAQLGPGRGP